MVSTPKAIGLLRAVWSAGRWGALKGESYVMQVSTDDGETWRNTIGGDELDRPFTVCVKGADTLMFRWVKVLNAPPQSPH